MDRKELIQLYYNEALDLILNNKLTNEGLKKLQNKFEKEDFQLFVFYNEKTAPDKVQLIRVLDKLSHKTKDLHCHINELNEYETVYLSQYTGNNIEVKKELENICLNNKTYLLNFYWFEFDKPYRSDKYRGFDDSILRQLSFYLRFYLKLDFDFETVEDLKKLKEHFKVEFNNSNITLTKEDYKFEILSLSKPVKFEK